MIAMDDRNLVAPEDACPICGERDADWLIWDEESSSVTCTTCGKVYAPPSTKGGTDESP